MEKLTMQSHDVIGSNTRKIAQLFPHCVTERKGKDGRLELAIDFEKLQAELSNELIGEGEERYQFTWPDKRKAVREANVSTTSTLRPCREESVDFDNTQNLYIEGDNLEVLKVLRETYLGKVKMIYIDPPYNTGNDFVYNDSRKEGLSSFENHNGLYDENGMMQLHAYERNTESNGRFHTDWLNMIYPRLKVAKDLLSDDGVIFISIDDNEVENLKKVCDEVYGSVNFISQICLVNNIAGRSDSKHIAKAHEYILIYQKSDVFISNGMPLSDEQLSEYKFEDNRGKYRLQGLRKRGSGARREDRPNMFYPIYYNETTKKISSTPLSDCISIIPKLSDNTEGRWRWGKETFENNIDRIEIRLVSGRGEYDVFERVYLNNDGDMKTTKMKSFLLEATYTSDNATSNFRGVMEPKVFDSPKSASLLKDIVRFSNSERAVILDFFSGSATTAHAVMKLNAEDGGNRKFIMVQLPEKTDEKSEAYKAGYKNICEIGKERIRRAGKKVKEEAGLQGQNLDTGFRVLKLDSSNMEDVYYTPAEFEMGSLFAENVKADRTSEDLLFQVMLDLGVELSAQIKNEKLEMKDGRTITVHNVDDGYLMACFDRDIDEATITEIAKRKPIYFVMRDASATNDNVIDNFEQIFRHYSPETTCRMI